MTVAPWPLLPSTLALIGVAVVIVVAGVRLTRVADALAERTGLGDALGGALLLGAVTSLPGNVTVVTGALGGDAGFALGNPVGGIALQTVWLAIADLIYRRANLEHAAASLQNVLQSVVLIAMLAVPVVAYATPTLTVGWIHPLTLLIPALYAYGLVLLRQMQRAPMWQPTRTAQTADDDEGNDPDGEGTAGGTSTGRLWGTLAGLGLVVGVAGWVVGRAGLSVVAATGLDGGLVGFTLTTAISSLPELVVLVTAVRMGQLIAGRREHHRRQRLRHADDRNRRRRLLPGIVVQRRRADQPRPARRDPADDRHTGGRAGDARAPLDRVRGSLDPADLPRHHRAGGVGLTGRAAGAGEVCKLPDR